MSKKNTDIDIDKLFEESNFVNGMKLDIDCPLAQKAKTSLDDGFQISTMSAVEELKEYIAFNYTNCLNLYRGHESNTYKLESTIARISKQNNICSPQKVVDVESNGYNMFCSNVFKNGWLKYKLNSSDEDMFKMSIGRHLGLPCRLIDVTANLETAIWFAVMNPKYYDKDGEIVLIVLDKDKFVRKSTSPISTAEVSYAHETLGVVDSLDELPLGKQRRFMQNGHFIWVGNDSLLNEQQVIEESAIAVRHFTIPQDAKPSLASEVIRDFFSGCAYRSDIERIKKCMVEL